MAPKKKDAVDPRIAELEAKHGQVVAFTVGGKLFVFRALDSDEFEDFQARAKTAQPGPINRECCQVALVHPTVEEFDEMRKAVPGFPGVAAQAIMEMAFSGIERAVKKG